MVPNDLQELHTTKAEILYYLKEELKRQAAEQKDIKQSAKRVSDSVIELKALMKLFTFFITPIMSAVIAAVVAHYLN